MTIPFLDVGAAYREIKPAVDAAVQRVFDSGVYVLGPEVASFEVEWADYCHASHAVGVASGLDALILALRALDIGPGDEVIVPSNTFIATWLAVSAVGATVVPVEPDPMTYNITPQDVAAAVTRSTKADIAVHLYGQPADLDGLISLAREHNLRVIEDAAQAHGARYKGQTVGSHGDVVCWSFYPGKNLGAFGDGGAITTNSADIAEEVQVLRNYGSRQRYHYEVQGMNSRLDPVQASVLRAKLPHLDAWTGRRRTIAGVYRMGLSDTGLGLPKVPEWADPVWHLFVVRSRQRDLLQKRLTEAGVGTLIHYPVPPHEQRAFADLGCATWNLPLARQLSAEVLSLPMGPHLGVDQAYRVVDAVRAIAADIH